MADARFARLKTDPRFRKPKRKEHKVVIDDRFKSLFEDEKPAKGKGKAKALVDKYGRPVAPTQNRDNLRRFYRLEETTEEPPSSKGPDYARGEVLLESSDEEEESPPGSSDRESENENEVVVLGSKLAGRKAKVDIDEDEDVDLDESAFADLDAQAAAYNAEAAEETETAAGERTRRLAVVNLDWDHVQASHLYKIFSSVLSSGSSSYIGGKVLSVRVYPSEFGKKRIEREEKEGPPAEIFKRNKRGNILEEENEEEVNEKTIFQEDEGDEYDEDALRTYQLERLRYYYAVVECDSPSTAAYIYAELDGTELERSANVFDLSFVPDDMKFEDEFRDEATGDVLGNKGLEFTTAALRHSKVKLTWDDDDPTRTEVTRRPLTRKEIEENDFKAYIASSSEESEDEEEASRRDRLRALLLNGGDNDELPEGWGGDGMVEKSGENGEMEITFMPGLSEANKASGEEETTLERYRRKQKEKKAKRKAEKSGETEVKTKGKGDDFFGSDSDEEGEDEPNEKVPAKVKRKDMKKKSKRKDLTPEPSRLPSTKEELSLILAPDSKTTELRHFSMKEVIKADKTKKGKKGKRRENKDVDGDEGREDGAGFEINVKDDRFKALHEEHEFAIDPSNPHFKPTKAMTALLSERVHRQKNLDDVNGDVSGSTTGDRNEISRLVESVKRKSSAALGAGGKRRKL